MLVTVVLALTGFSSSGKSRSRGSSHGGSGSSSGSGGGSGCSSPERGNGSSSSSSSGSGTGTRHDTHDDRDSSAGGSTSGGATSEADGARARVVTCVSGARGKRKAVTYATVRVAAERASTEATYDIDVTFTDAAGSYVDFGDAEVTLDGGETRTVRVPMDRPREVARVRRCEVAATVAG
ncbi:hypothetical protein [Streptomyces corynorhini]|uniref:hypothetical protein n=1 Tax=Streptomyces corynorhini TaxID=2282652 RepID=UPI001F24D732|nr:hypothetical protein [Streptomyces corynorhini]